MRGIGIREASERKRLFVFNGQLIAFAVGITTCVAFGIVKFQEQNWVFGCVLGLLTIWMICAVVIVWRDFWKSWAKMEELKQEKK